MLAAQWDTERNGTLTPQQVTLTSNRKVWWICEKGHSFQTVIASRANGTGCPYCTNRKVLAGFNDLATVEPKIASEWHPTLNGALTPEMVTVGSTKKVWWECPLGHVWKATIYSRTGAKKCGCPVCAGKTRSVCPFEGLLKYSHDVAPQDTYERCVLCGKETDVPIDLPIDRRDCYVEDSGQLCRDCWQRAYGE